jgi:LDH2 family malate/lactate/ureidoglycolate dehydrogenase
VSCRKALIVMATDPMISRSQGEFEVGVASFLGVLRATTPVYPAQPVMVAVDPQWKTAKARVRDGIPVRPGLHGQVR